VTAKVFEIYQRHGTTPAANTGVHSQDRVVLDHLQRERGRLKVLAESGAELHIFLERGKTLAIGEILESKCGVRFEVCGALESVARGEAPDWQVFARACYHLGNRHVKIQVGERWLHMTPDPVLEQMLTQLGVQVSHQQAVFVPEAGAYADGAQHGHHHH
jgi:urease accessory protein